MTKLLEQALEAALGLPPDLQDDIARVMFNLAGNEGPAIILSIEERTALDYSKAAAARGEFATAEQVTNVWAKHRL